MASKIKKFLQKHPQLRWLLKRVEFYINLSVILIRHNSKTKCLPDSFQDFYIFGWYGTETVGDKFILLGLLHHIFSQDQEKKVAICSINPKFSKNTLRELSNATSSFNLPVFSNWIEECCCVEPQSSIYSAKKNSFAIIGGGPIMDDPEIFKWLLIAKHLQKNSVKLFIFGCGLGPLRSTLSKYFANTLLNKAEHIICRNSHPILENHPHQVALDPSFLTLKIFGNLPSRPREKHSLAYNARAIPFQYAPMKKGLVALYMQNEKSKLIKFIKDNNIKTINVFSTHQLDSYTDLDIAKDILSDSAFKGIKIRYIGDDIEKILETVSESGWSISTRYHGFIISIICGALSYGNDYNVGGGKIQQLYQMLSNTKPNSNAYNSAPLQDGDFLSFSTPSTNKNINDLLIPYQDLIWQKHANEYK